MRLNWVILISAVSHDLDTRFMRIALASFVFFWLAGCQSVSDVKLRPVVETQWTRYPEMQVQDWYKLLHQASMGNRHLGVEDSLIYNYLIGEMDRIEASASEPLIEYISPDSMTVRLNLRPYKAGGGDPAALFSAMQSTWDTVEPSTELLAAYWNDLLVLSKADRLKPSADVFAGFFSEKSKEGFPAVHHSQIYNEAYKPAYRVLLREYIPE